ncbi:hypothetical protein BTO09_04920 [Gilvibacter sp. SZ-19]|uniref:hypothetical protein n=1 Tax=Gilvibacter sp. SZ-19 TaxID=754429 RepID=UPI000B3CC603|nr:hypothetical protein [Gilvibacter sp. SZ-19]ARV11725.1 hypothetical protein BTO09_04920 [Gilvibacter sp. SZ-19]
MDEIFKDLITAYTPKEVTNVIKKIGANKILWENVGKRRNNLATINIGTDPAAGVTERITNAIDAILEKEWKIQGKPEGFRSPRKAVENWFNIEDGKISSIISGRDKKIEELSDKVKVSLFNSGKDSKPTVEIRDKGIGLEPEEFSKTILDLNGSNKIGKLHLMGAFGQGGSTALAYNNYTIIISKPHFKSDDRKKSKIAFTIVRINPGDIDKDKHEWYEYMLDKTTGQPFTIEIDDNTFEPGTLVRHVLMDLGKYSGSMTAPQRGLWYLAHNYMFDPIIPFTISDCRKDKPVNRTVTGNNRLLTHNENREYHNQVTLTFKTGKVTIYWWVLNTLGKDPRERIKHYASVSKPIIITHNGQKQGTLGNGLIKNDLKLPYLDRYLIVHIETDYLDNDSKRQLFSSTRESLKDTAIVEELRKLTIETLKEDDKLQQLNQDRKQRYFTKDDTQVLDSLKKRLARRINTFLQSSGSGTSVTTSTIGESSPTKKLPEIPFEDPPTFFEITTPSPKEVYANKSFSIKFKTDAHPNYFAKAETFAAFIDPQSIGSYTGTARVNNGYGIAYFKTNEDAEIDDKGEITLDLRPIGQKSISSSIEIKIVDRPEDSGNGNNGKNKSPNIRVDFIGQDHPFFEENHWNEHSVASVISDKDEVVIYVSEENKNLQKLVERAQRKNDAAVQNIKNKYLEHISFHAFVLDKNNPEKLLSEDDEEIPSDSYEIIKESELRNASETVCGMINDFFESIIIESVELESSEK